MRLSSTPEMNILLVTMARMWPPKYDSAASSEAWTLMLRLSKPTSAALIHLTGDLAGMHVLQRGVDRTRVPADGGYGAALGLARLELRRGQHVLVAHLPLAGIQHGDAVGTRLGGLRQLRPGVRA